MKDNKDKQLQKEISNLLLYSYKDDAYGRLTELYDRIKNIDISKVGKKEAKGLFFEIERVTNEAKDYAMRTYLKEEKLNNIVRRIADINKVKNNINCFSKEELDEWKDAFDFDLKPEYPQEHKEVKEVERASEISKKIDEFCKAATFKTSKEKNNKRGPKSKEAKELSHYIIKEWNENGKKLFAGTIKTKFIDYGEDYKNGKKQNINLLALALADLKVIKTPNKKIQFETVLKAILGKDTFSTTSDQSNFGTLIRNGYKSNDVYIEVEKELKTILEELIKYKN